MDISGILLVVLFAFLAEYIDSSLGMGYGTTLTPVLLVMGFPVSDVVPAVLLSELITGFFSAFLFHKAKIVQFDFQRDEEMVKKYGKLLYFPKSQDAQIVFVLSFCSIIGCIFSIMISLHLPKLYLQLTIGMIVLSMGIYILFKKNTTTPFSWPKILTLGSIAAFNKGISGGGYGPLMTAGQILCGANSKNSIAITSFAEGFTCFIGLITYFSLGKSISWNLAQFLLIGAVLSVPIAVYTIKKIEIKKFTTLVGLATLVLGLYTVLKAVL
ncbi:MAG: sulfite exporter TauE/SafE family protein [Candidatus Brocadiae bacterium]|nr:sulfite exporter TauE/SafE family protein [Candidatus Brocadiia bacterium]